MFFDIQLKQIIFINSREFRNRFRLSFQRVIDKFTANEVLADNAFKFTKQISITFKYRCIFAEKAHFYIVRFFTFSHNKNLVHSLYYYHYKQKPCNFQYNLKILQIIMQITAQIRPCKAFESTNFLQPSPTFDVILMLCKITDNPDQPKRKAEQKTEAKFAP